MDIDDDDMDAINTLIHITFFFIILCEMNVSVCVCEA